MSRTITISPQSGGSVSVDIGQTITFTSRVPDVDGVQQSGIVLGVVGYDAASQLEDVAALNNTTTETYKSDDITAEEFVLVKSPNGIIHPWYENWITDVAVSGATSSLLRIYHGDTGQLSLTTIQNILRAANISFRMETS